MQPFLGPDFLLDSEPARRLYHEVAAGLPIIDYHNHLPPEEIAEDRKWDNIGELWLGHDHYKWRLMRWAGIDEKRVTGSASWREKFDAFAETMPQCIGNPMYHWSHLELWRYFGLEGTVLSPATADRCWEAANAQLSRPECSARGLLTRMKVELVGTTDDPADSLEHHERMLREGLPFRVVPSFRPDKAIKIEADGFPAYLERLSAASGVAIGSFEDLVGALVNRLDRFVELGCRATDHGLDLLRPGRETTAARLDAILRKRLDGARAGRSGDRGLPDCGHGRARTGLWPPGLGHAASHRRASQHAHAPVRRAGTGYGRGFDKRSRSRRTSQRASRPARPDG